MSFDTVEEAYTIVGEAVVCEGLQSFRGGVCALYITQPTPFRVPVLLHTHSWYQPVQYFPNKLLCTSLVFAAWSRDSVSITFPSS